MPADRLVGTASAPLPAGNARGNGQTTPATQVERTDIVAHRLGEAHMTKPTRNALLLASLGLTAGASVARAQGTGKALDACTLLSGPEVRSVAKRSDLATGQPRTHQSTTAAYSSCILAGAIDIGITLNRNTNDFYARMRDTYLKAPPNAGFRVEKQSGLGDDAYVLYAPPGMDVRLEMLVGERRISVSVKKTTDTKQAVPEAEAKRIALAVAKALVPKVR
jgi:hypothetical protein